LQRTNNTFHNKRYISCYNSTYSIMGLATICLGMVDWNICQMKVNSFCSEYLFKNKFKKITYYWFISRSLKMFWWTNREDLLGPSLQINNPNFTGAEALNLAYRRSVVLPRFYLGTCLKERHLASSEQNLKSRHLKFSYQSQFQTFKRKYEIVKSNYKTNEITFNEKILHRKLTLLKN
jgi:hypothetical protein